MASSSSSPGATPVRAGAGPVAEASSRAAGSVRIDKWLWAARFFKTRGLAQNAIENGRVLVEGERVKAARALRVGERVVVRIGDVARELFVRGLSETRGPAPVAQQLYQETAESVALREAARERRGLEREPAATIRGRPTKRERRQLERARDGT
ncbi:MAG: RNA-binding S4 domain-containing protein [Burkholderiales bacterium]|nr:MAG: RNA-binding S4 domain-containing protein [Burkholderiales bacterium]